MKNKKWLGKYLCPGCFIPSGGTHKTSCKFQKLSKDKQDIMELQARLNIMEQNFDQLVRHYNGHRHYFEVPWPVYRIF